MCVCVCVIASRLEIQGFISCSSHYSETSFLALEKSKGALHLYTVILYKLNSGQPCCHNLLLTCFQCSVMDYHGRMENPLSTRVIAASHDKGTASSSDKHNANKNSLHVGFSEEKGEVKEKRERFLTAKYGVSASCQKAISQTISTWILFINKFCLFTLPSLHSLIKWLSFGKDWLLKCGSTSSLMNSMAVL